MSSWSWQITKFTNTPDFKLDHWVLVYLSVVFLLFLWGEFSSFFISGFLSVEKWNVFIIFISDFFSSMKFGSFYQWVFDCFISKTDLIVLSAKLIWLFYKQNWFDCFYQWFLIVLQVKLFSSFLSVVFDCFMCEIVFIIIFCISDETWVI